MQVYRCSWKCRLCRGCKSCFICNFLRLRISCVICNFLRLRNLLRLRGCQASQVHCFAGVVAASTQRRANGRSSNFRHEGKNCNGWRNNSQLPLVQGLNGY
jgi:hypothetical protein